MIRSNLAVLLAERNLRISRVSADTGISRTTLTALSSNNFQGIQMETLNQLCQYLNVRPESILHYISFDVTVKNFAEESEGFAVIAFETNIGDKVQSFEIPGMFQMKEHYDENDNEWILTSDFYAELWPEDEYNELPRKVFKQLPIQFLKDIEKDISRHIRWRSEHDINPENLCCVYHWEDFL